MSAKRLSKVVLTIAMLLISIEALAIGNSALNKELLRASSRGDTSIVKDLISRGADINTRDSLGNTPLIIASDNGYQEIVRYLISKRAAINAVNNYGYTSLLSAMTNGHRTIVQLLLSAGADEKIENKFGTSPLTVLTAAGYKDFEEYIKDRDYSKKATVFSPIPKRGSTGAIHNTRWREHFNMLVGKGDNAGAAEYLVSIASNSNFEAQYLLGMLLIERGNVAEGLDWLMKSVKSNDKELLYNVGRLIVDEELGIDKRIGLDLLKRAGALGSLDAKVAYAKAELFGTGVPMNYASAFKTFSEAAKNGSAEGEFYVGYMMYTGKGQPTDLIRGMDYIKSSAKSGLEEADSFIRRLQSEEIMMTIASSEAKDRAKLKSYLVSLEAIPEEQIDEKCDTFDISDIIINEYGIEKVDLCYIGNGKVTTTYYSTLSSDNELSLYLQNLAKDATFKNSSE